MADKHATIYDVADLAGVSIATVSRALSGGSVSAASKRKVDAAIAALNYRAAAKPESTQQGKRAIALVMSSVNNPYNATLFSGASEAVTRGGFLPQLYHYPENTPCSVVVDDLIAQRPAGALLAGFPVENGDTETIRRELTRLQEAMPIVAVGPRIEGFHCARLTSQPDLCVRKAVRHLAQLGHRRIAFIGGARNVRFCELRLAAYREEMAALSAPIPDGYIQLTGFMPQSGKEGIAQMLRGSSPRPTAVFAVNDLVALGAMQQLQAAGLRIPQDISIIGCDNAFFSPYLTPPLSTVDLHPYSHGQQAIAELIVAIGGGNPYSFDTAFEASLIIRESSGAAPED